MANVHKALKNDLDEMLNYAAQCAPQPLVKEARSDIAALRSHVAELLAALEPFAGEMNVTKIPAAEYAEAVERARAVIEAVRKVKG
jgi:hypothetical protein